VVNKFAACRVVDDFDRSFVFDEWKAEHSDLESIKDMLNDLSKWDTLITRYIRP